MPEPLHILYCHCAYSDLVPDAVRDRVLGAVAASGVRYTAVPDLCLLAARKDERLLQLAREPGLRIAACTPRTVRWLFHAAGAELPAETPVLNLRADDAEVVLHGLLDDAAAPAGDCPEMSRPDEWVPWFPVIDRDRCAGCRQCLSFCPFGVYELSREKQVVATHPENCKNNCPACARICPEIAIIFPKSPDRPINGAEVTPEDES